MLDTVVTGLNVDLYEFNIGLAEAFDAERGFSDVIAPGDRARMRARAAIPARLPGRL